MTRLAIEHVNVRLGDDLAVRDISASFDAGECVAILGPNGAGKSTLLRALAGLLPCKGSIALDGRPLAAMTRAERARRIAFLPQDHQMHWPLPAREIVALGRFPHGAADPQRLPPADAAIVDEAMAACDVAPFADRPATDLSGGERARVALARVLAVQAPVVLADEPTASLDPRHQLAIMEVLRDTARRGTLVLAVTHAIDQALSFADRILVLHQGRVAGCGTPAATLSPRLLADVFGLRAEGTRPRWERLA